MRGWDEDKWALLVQSKLEGKAREEDTSLSEEEASDYKVIKEAVLGSTLVSTRLYRETFRRVRKRPGATYLEMARDCCLKLKRWMKAEEATTVEEMKGVLLIEQFMDQVTPNLKYELMSHNVKNVMEAGRRANSY